MISDDHYYKKRDVYLKKTYNISLQDYYKMSDEQHDRCLICHQHESDSLGRPLRVDHSKDGKIRGLLCNDCNSTLGVYEWRKFLGRVNELDWPKESINKFESYIQEHGDAKFILTHYPDGKKR